MLRETATSAAAAKRRPRAQEAPTRGAPTADLAGERTEDDAMVTTLRGETATLARPASLAPACDANGRIGRFRRSIVERSREPQVSLLLQT